MAFTKEIQEKLRAALPGVDFNEINLRLEERVTAIDFLYNGKLVATRRLREVHNGDTVNLKGFTGKLPTMLRFDPDE